MEGVTSDFDRLSLISAASEIGGEDCEREVDGDGTPSRRSSRSNSARWASKEDNLPI